MDPYLIAADGTSTKAPRPAGKRGYTLDELYSVVQTDIIEIVRPPRAKGWVMVVDENGWLRKGARVNEAATDLAGNHGFLEALTGNVLVCDRKDIR